MKLFRAWLFLGLISACSSDNTPADGGAGDAANDTTTTKDATNDAPKDVQAETGNDATTDSPADAPVDAPADVKADVITDAGSVTYTLTINDYLSWCSTSVNGGTPSTTAVQVYNNLPADAAAALAGDTANASLFYWGYWQSANLGDGGKYTSKNVSITMNSNVSVTACCPFNDAALSCP